jgi:hypothetical protein
VSDPVKSKKGLKQEEAYKVVRKALQKTPTSAAPRAVKEIVTKIFTLPLGRKDSAEWAHWRHMKLSFWLQALDQVHAMKDEAWDPDDLPYMNIGVPGETQYSAGVSPDSIEDPETRKKYEEALKKNAEKAERYRRQSDIRELERWCLERLQAYINTHYTDGEEDLDEIRRAMDQQLSTTRHRRQVHRALLQQDRAAP